MAPRTRAFTLLAATAVSAVALAVAPPSARATLAFGATSSADVVHLSYFVTDAPLAESIADGGSPSAQAALDSFGTSTAQAAAIFPGVTVATMPPTLRGLLPVATPIPDFPFVAQSRYPSQSSSEQTAGPFDLSANSQAQASTADAGGSMLNQAGVGVGRASAHAEASTDGSRVTASASNDASGISGLALQVGAVHALAELTYDGSSYKHTSEFSVTSLSVAGVALTLGPAGLSLAGQQVPLPDSSPVLQILSDQGLTVRYLAPQITTTSVLTAGLEVDKDIDPPSGAPIGTITQRLVFGRAFVAITNASSFDDAAPPSEASPSEPADTSPGTDSSTAPVGLTSGPLGAPPLLAGGSSAPGAVTEPQVAVPQAVAAALTPSAQILPRSLDLLPPFVIGALALLLISQTSRILGVRQP